MKLAQVYAIFSLIIISTGCSVYQSKNDLNSILSGYKSGVTPTSYALVNQAVFSVSCTSCHSASMKSGGIELDTYAQVYANLALIQSAAITNQIMPPTGGLNAQQITILQDWIKAGAPESESTTVTSSQTPVPTATPVVIGTPVPGGGALSSVSYAQVASAIFTPSCVSCHSGSSPSAGISLDTYAAVYSNVSLIQSVAITSTLMPPGGALSASNQTLLQTWISQGAPQTVNQPVVTPSPTPALVATYTSIRAQIILPKCLLCHVAGGGGDGLVLDTYSAVNKNKSDMLEKIKDGSMPPRGYTAVTPAELTVFQQWISAGAPNN